MTPHYTARDLALLVPTKDRPQKMRNLLESLVAQGEPCGRVIVVASGQNIQELVLAFADRLPVEYHHCEPPGQIRQRNLGIALLDPAQTPLVAFLDDDIVLEAGAQAAMLEFWNRPGMDPAGVAFNLVNMPAYVPSLFRRLFLVDGDDPGRVLPSGANTPVWNVPRDIHSQWLPGGATVWRCDLVKTSMHQEIYAKRALCEDLIFSYPIGKTRDLYVCAAARARHEHVEDHARVMVWRYYGRVDVLWRLHFVRQNAELSLAAFVWMVLGKVLGDLLKAAAGGGVDRLHKAWGELEGLTVGLGAVRKGIPMAQVLDERG